VLGEERSDEKRLGLKRTDIFGVERCLWCVEISLSVVEISLEWRDIFGVERYPRRSSPLED